MKRAISLILTFLIVIVISNQLEAQTTTAFRKNYKYSDLMGIPGNIIEGLTNETYIMAGTNVSIPIRGTISQLNSTGNVDWSYAYSDASFAFELRDIKKDQSNSQYYLCGGSSSNAGIFMIINATGNVVNSRRFQVAEASGVNFERVIKATDGGYVIVGSVTNHKPGGGEINFNSQTYYDSEGNLQTASIHSPLIVKLDVNGNYLWHHIFRYYTTAAKNPNDAIQNSGYFNDVVEVDDGYFAVGQYKVNQFGSSTNSDGDDTTPTDAIVLKTTKAGAITYHKQIDAPSTSTSQSSKYLSAVNKTSAGDIITAGYDNGRELIQKYQPNGGFVNIFSNCFEYSSNFLTGTDPVDVSQIYEVNGSTDLVTMSMYVKISLLFPSFHNTIHRVNSNATANVWTKRYDFGLASIMPRGGKVSDGGYANVSINMNFMGFDYHVIKTDPNGDTPIDNCEAQNFSPSFKNGPKIFADPYYKSFVGNGQSNAVSIARTTVGITETVQCEKLICDAPDQPDISTLGATCKNASYSVINNYDPNVTYVFTPSGPTVDASGNILGTVEGTTYTVIAVLNDCASEPASFVNQKLPTPPAPTINTTNASCSSGGSATITNYNSSYTYTFTPSGPSVGSGGVITGAVPGQTYVVSATNPEGCSSPGQNFVIQGQLLTPTISVSTVNPANCGSNGTINFTFTNVPNGTYTVNYNGGSFTVTVTNGTGSVSAPPGTYNNLIINNGDCTSANGVNAIIIAPSAPDTPILSTTPPTCSSSGVTTITNYNSGVTYVFTPSGPTVNSSGVIIGAVNGQTYTVSASLNNCSSGTVSFTNLEKLPTPNKPTISVTPPSCSASGSATISNYDPSVTYQFNPTGPTVNNGAINNVTPNVSYTVTATNGHGCVSETTQFIVEEELPTPTISVTVTNPTTCGGNGTINFTFTGVENGTYTVYYNGGSFTVTVTNNTGSVTVGAGQYSNIIITNNQGCTSANGVNITLVEPNAPNTPSITTLAATCNSNGISTINNYNGNYNYTFSPSGPSVNSNGQIINANPGTTYTVTAEQNNCFSSAATFTIDEILPTPNTPTLNVQTSSCAADGEAIITNYDSNNTYTFSPSGPTVGSNGEIIGANYGTNYTITATNSDGCESSASSSFTIEEMLPTPIITISKENPTECGGNGTINFTFTGIEDGTYTIYYDGGSYTITIVNGTASISVGSGAYTNFIITNNDGCTSVIGVSATLADPNAPNTPVITIVSSNCNEDGSGVINNYNSNINYTFSPSGPSVNANGDIINANPGTTYTVTAEENNCISDGTSFTIEPMLPTPTVPTISIDAPTCSDDGEAVISNYNSNNTYTFSPSGPTVGSNGEIIGAVLGTTYTVTTTNTDGCESQTSSSFTVEEMLPTPTISINSDNPDECGGDGTIYFTFTGIEDGTYTINYDGGSYTITIVNGTASIQVGAGSYDNFIITNNDGCTATNGISITLVEPNAPDVPNITTVDATCDSEGISTINNYDSNINYTFTPSGPTVNANGEIENANPGTSYTITAEENECISEVATFEIDPMLPTPSAPTVSIQTPTCSIDGEAVINNYDSNNTYTFSPTGPSVGSNGEIIGAVYGTTYTVTTTNTDGCESNASSSFTVEEILPTPIITISGEDPEECGGEGTIYFTFTDIEDGTYTINYDGGSYTITIVNGEASISAESGAYTNFIITNDDGCSSSIGVSISLADPNAPDTPTIDTEEATCDSEGFGIISNYDSNINYTFSPNGPTVNTNGEIENANPGTNYYVTAEENGCTSGGTSFTIEDMLPSSDTPIINIEEATCSADGGAEISNFDEDNSYTFEPSGPTVGANGEIIGADFGVDYTIISTNTDGCISEESESFTIDEMLETPTISIDVEDPEECGGEGTINFTFTGVDDGIYTIEYDNGSFTVEVTNGEGSVQVEAGSYENIIISNGDCESVAGIDVLIVDPNAPDAPIIDMENATCESESIHTITNYGEDLSYTFTPSGPTVDNNGVIQNAEAGVEYTVTVEENDCVSSATTFEIDEILTAPTISISAANTEICLGETITLVADGGDTYNWDNGLGSGNSHTVSPTDTTTYTVIGIDEFGCEGTDSITIIVNELPTIEAFGEATICEGETVTIYAEGGNTYNWDNLGSGATQTVNPTTTTTYVVTGSDDNGCENTASVTITVNQNPDVEIVAENENICAGSSTTITATGADSYVWEDLGTDATYTVSPTENETYTVIGTDENGCQTTTSITINVHEFPTISAGDDMTICYGDEAELHGEGGFSYEWDNDLGEGETHIVSPTTTTTYEVIGSDEYGCENTASVTIFVNPIPHIEGQEEYKVCLGSEITLSVTEPDDNYTYTWVFGDEVVGEGITHTVTAGQNDHGIYTVFAQNEEGCYAELDVMLNVNICDLEITEVITPNGDGSNDYFYIEHLEAYPNSEVWIYNRWGTEVYYSENYLNDWDGTSQSNLNVGSGDLPEGTYYYILKLGGDESMVNYGKIYKGFVYIKR